MNSIQEKNGKKLCDPATLTFCQIDVTCQLLVRLFPSHCGPDKNFSSTRTIGHNVLFTYSRYSILYIYLVSSQNKKCMYCSHVMLFFDNCEKCIYTNPNDFFMINYLKSKNLLRFVTFSSTANTKLQFYSTVNQKKENALYFKSFRIFLNLYTIKFLRNFSL